MSHHKYKDIGSPAMNLIEECGELIQAVCKAERFGYNNFHPQRAQFTNLQEIEIEMQDVRDAFIKLIETIIIE